MQSGVLEPTFCRRRRHIHSIQADISSSILLDCFTSPLLAAATSIQKLLSQKDSFVAQSSHFQATYFTLNGEATGRTD